MFIILLTLGERKEDAPRWMEAHKAWIAQGFDKGMFQLLGSLVPAQGGAIIVRAQSRAEVEAFIALDPFVEHKVADAAIHEFTPSRVALEWEFLLENTG